MSTDVAGTPAAGAPPKRWMLWTGRVLTGVGILGLAFSGVAKLTGATEVMNNMVNQFGYPAGIVFAIGILELTCTVIYAVPQTSVLGALLLTGYLGGAVATHARIGESVVSPIIAALIIWGGLFLRDARLRALLPLRTRPGN